MDLKDLITYIDLQLIEMEDSGEDLDCKSWGMQEGILLTGNEAWVLINKCRALAKPPLKESVLPISDVSNCISCLNQYKSKDFKECKTCKKNSNYTTI